MADLKDVLDSYNVILNSIYEHVHFKENYVVYPINDLTDCYWMVDDDIIRYSQYKNDLLGQKNNTYSGTIYRSEFYSESIYRGAEYTLIFLDTISDGIVYFAIFMNDKKI